MENSLEALGITNNKQLKKFYAQWSINASKLIKKYAEEKSIAWYNTKWRKSSKEIPFYIRMKAPKTFKGSVWFASSPVNYAYGKSVPKLKATQKIIPRSVVKHPVNANGKWFTPKKYKPDITSINQSLLDEDLRNKPRYWASKTSHKGTHKYKRPLLWAYNNGKVSPVFLKDQLGDLLYNDPNVHKFIDEAFTLTVNDKKYI